MDFTDGWNFIEWGAICAAAAAILGLLFLIYDRLIRPVIKAAAVINERWDDTGKIKEINQKIDTIAEAITPTNGDPRSISDRLDDIGHKAIAATKVSEETRREVREYQREEIIERRARQREAIEERRQTNVRLEQLEQRQNEMSARQTRVEGKVDKVLNHLRGEDEGVISHG